MDMGNKWTGDSPLKFQDERKDGSQAFRKKYGRHIWLVNAKLTK